MPPKKANTKNVVKIVAAKKTTINKATDLKKCDTRNVSTKKTNAAGKVMVKCKVCVKCGEVAPLNYKDAAISENKRPLVPRNSQKTKNKNPSSVIDPVLELIDPNPDIEALFKEFDRDYFYGMLSKNKVTVQWSKRLKSSVGVCRDEYPPLITLSEPLLKLRPRKDTVETLLHEMIHAYLAVAPGQFEYEAHGRKFHKHMKRIDRLAGTKLEVEHDFHDEVEYYSYIWECSGKCKKEIVNCYNRPPGPANVWWYEHKKTCGGKFLLKQIPGTNENKINSEKK